MAVEKEGVLIKCLPWWKKWKLQQKDAENRKNNKVERKKITNNGDKKDVTPSVEGEGEHKNSQEQVSTKVSNYPKVDVLNSFPEPFLWTRIGV